MKCVELVGRKAGGSVPKGGKRVATRPKNNYSKDKAERKVGKLEKKE
jgi:hypothetical protein